MIIIFLSADGVLNNFVFGCRVMACLVVKMHERPLNLVEVLELRLERLADVVRLEEAHLLRQNDVDFDEEVVAEVECANGIDVSDLLVVIHCNPRDPFEELRARSVTSQHLYLLCIAHVNQ